MKTSEHLIQGDIYTRNQLKERFQIKDANINTGIFHPAGHESVWLFITVEKPSYMPQLKDHLEGDLLDMEGQPTGRKDKLIIEHRQMGLELVLFYRHSKSELPNYGFRYIGEFEYIYHEGIHPSRILLAKIGHESQVEIITQNDATTLPVEESLFEGGISTRWTNRYERNPRLRALAIEFHKPTCHICNFDFERTYGVLGKGFIEVHHLQPISELVLPTQIDYKTDMITVCANCHRMLHHKGSEPLSPEELKSMLRS